LNAGFGPVRFGPGAAARDDEPMTKSLPRFLLLALHGASLAAALAAPPAQAQYKLVSPDGKVTYTDRAPAAAIGHVTELGARDNSSIAVSSPQATLPFELRQTATRYPVVLYVSNGACEPCEGARQLLRQRGIPYAEKQVIGAEDGDALERLSGGRDAPTLTIGSQVLRGLAPSVWTSYLDAAGYPQASKLPSQYRWPAATPVVERREAAAAPTQPARDPEPAPLPRRPATIGGIQF
jgi:glutaredoxin